MHVNSKRTNTGLKYSKRGGVSTRMAKCGHVSHEGRYNNCERCIPVLPEDDGDLNYFQTDMELGDLEENCE